jgi:hypothetical protein
MENYYSLVQYTISSTKQTPKYRSVTGIGPTFREAPSCDQRKNKLSSFQDSTQKSSTPAIYFSTWARTYTYMQTNRLRIRVHAPILCTVIIISSTVYAFMTQITIILLPSYTRLSSNQVYALKWTRKQRKVRWSGKVVTRICNRRLVAKRKGRNDAKQVIKLRG